MEMKKYFINGEPVIAFNSGELMRFLLGNTSQDDIALDYRGDCFKIAGKVFFKTSEFREAMLKFNRSYDAREYLLKIKADVQEHVEKVLREQDNSSWTLLI